MRLLFRAVLLAIAITCAVAPDAVAQRRVALVIGNDSYPLAPLDNPGRDARVVAAALQRLGFALVGGGPLLNLGKATMDRAVEAFGASASGADIALFYFAGHGMQVDGVNYLAPIDLQLRSRETVSLYTLNADVLLQVMDSSGARLKIMLLDACRTNPFSGRRASGGGLHEMKVPVGTIVGFATQPNAEAADGTGANNGPYAKALERYLGVRGLEVWPLLNEVGLAVMASTDNAQRPWVSSSPIPGKAYLNPPLATAELPTVPPALNYGHPSLPQPNPGVNPGQSLGYIQQAYKQLNDNDYRGARVTLTRAIDADATLALPYRYRGFAWYLEGTTRTDPAEALAAYRAGFPDLDRAVQLDPSDATGRRHRGNTIVATYKALQALHRPVNDILDRAIDDLRAAVTLDPTSKINVNALGQAYLLKGQYGLAIATFADAIAKDRSYAAPYDGTCVAYRMLGRQADARAYAKSAAARDSDLRSMSCLTRRL